MNYQIEKLHKDLYDLINNSGIPVGAAYYVVKDIMVDLKDAYQQSINSEIQSQKEETKE